MHNLVVCGAKNLYSRADGAMFPDFMGISTTARDLPTSKLDIYFQFPFGKTPRHTRITNISSGFKGPNAQPLYIYSRSNQDQWFESFSEMDRESGHQVDARKGKRPNPGDAANLGKVLGFFGFRLHGIRQACDQCRDKIAKCLEKLIQNF